MRLGIAVLSVFALVIGSSAPAQSGFAWTDVIGLKSCGSNPPPLCFGTPSTGPTNLFILDVAVPSIQDRGAVTLNGSQVDADGLALSPSHGLLAHALGSATSQLVSIDPVTAVATAIGPPITREIRGAAFDSVQDLFVLDVAAGEILRIDPVTGLEQLPAIPLTHGGNPLPVSSISDIAFDASDTCLLANLGDVYIVDLATGVSTLIRTDAGMCYAGAAVRAGGVPAELITYEICSTDDIFSLDLAPPGNAMNTVLSEILPSFNAGRGDLAAVPSLAIFAGCQSRNGTGVNPADFICVTPPILGTTWFTQVAVTPATTSTVIALTGAPAPVPTAFPFGPGELLISLAPAPILQGGTGTHAFALPDLPALIGFPFTSQGFRVEVGAGTVTVVPLNALDVTLGL